MTENERREMENQRREAVQRIKEFERRAQPSNEGDIPMPHFVKTPPQRKLPENRQMLNDSKPQKSNGLGLLKMLNLGSIKFDNDIVVIMMLIMLLGSDESDELLLLALLYIMW